MQIVRIKHGIESIDPEFYNTEWQVVEINKHGLYNCIHTVTKEEGMLAPEEVEFQET